MKHRFTVREVPPAVLRWPALAVAAGLLLGAWIIAIGAGLVREGRQASVQVAMAAQATAAGIDATLARFTALVQAVRPADFASTDRVEQSARLLRLQAFLPGSATFLLSADGQLLAASAPFTKQDVAVGDMAWFRQAIAAPPGALVPLRMDGPWLGMSRAVALTRAVTDAEGKPAGLIGAVMPRESLERLVAPDWVPQGMLLALIGGTGGEPLMRVRDWPATSGAAPAATHRLSLSFLAWLGGTTNWTGTAPLHTVAAAVTATLPANAALASPALSPPIILAGGSLLLGWLVCLAVVASGRPGEPTAPESAGYGTDWQCMADSAGVVTACRGTLPEALGIRTGQPLAAAPGFPGPVADAVGVAMRDATPVAGLEVGTRSHTWRISLVPTAAGFTCSGRDVTAETTARAALDAAEAAAAELRRNRDRLLISLGHDIRTPMASIMGTCELLLDGELEEDIRTWLERVQASCGALLGMLTGLLAVSENEAAPGTLACEPVDVGALIHEVVDVLRPQARDKALELHTRCDDLLRGQWMVDPARLRQVVFNLASNAVKYTPAGRVEIRASAVQVEGQTRLRIAVSDSGPGIDPSEREAIFERFRRGRAHESMAQGGLGLGLALCRENARLMGGSITLESALGVGSEFTFECPVERVAVRDRQLPFAGRTAIVVADEGPVARAVAAQLGELGLTVETAPDGYLGLALAERLDAQRGAVDLVLLQGNLPGMPGEAFMIRLRRTAFGRRAMLIWMGEGADPARADAIVPWPADPNEVAAVAKQLLAQRPSLDALAPHVTLLRGGRVLLVDDDKANRTLLTAALSRRGFAVFTAGDGEEALRLAARDSFDAILMDLQMPGLDGFETTSRLRTQPGHVSTMPIIALTALQGGNLRKRCEDAGFTAVLEKPVNLDRLTACLDHAIGGGLPTNADGIDYSTDVSLSYLEEMVAVVGMERARACVTEFIADATVRCRNLAELVPGWEVESILRCCETISGRAETCGAFALGELLEEIADAASRNDRETVAALVARLDTLIARLPGAMAACLDDIDRHWPRDSSKAA